ncbi:hypothetical protein [Pseudomonas sp. RIT-PI-q]|uniref:hypothetical protein n=1 Tax=Pseudomonas sp. RIT-PI-q TaxID=1690247 RepID=UPI000A955E1F|nr:hypothetical protein [Pseudomonas sp. RIT-PI-q]
MTFDSVLKTLGIRSKSLAEKVNDRVISGYVPSDMARTIVGKVSSRKINEMMNQASEKYNLENNVRIFKDE